MTTIAILKTFANWEIASDTPGLTIKYSYAYSPLLEQLWPNIFVKAPITPSNKMISKSETSSG